MKRLHYKENLVAKDFFDAIGNGDFLHARLLLERESRLKQSTSSSNKTPLMYAISVTCIDEIPYDEAVDFSRFLIEKYDVPPDEILGGDLTALQVAVDRGVIEIVELLLERGANPNLGRTLFSAIRDERRNGAKCIAALIKHGVDVNKVFAMFGDRKNAKTALDFTVNPEFKAMLLAAGAKTAAQVLKENPNTPIDGADQ
jgi:ankyrin repeat protein